LRIWKDCAYPHKQKKKLLRDLQRRYDNKERSREELLKFLVMRRIRIRYVGQENDDEEQQQQQQQVWK
jgi:hypothetical protein